MGAQGGHARIHYELTDVYTLHKLLFLSLGFKLENYADGKAAPKLTGRALAVETIRAQAEEAEADEGLLLRSSPPPPSSGWTAPFKGSRYGSCFLQKV